MMHVSCQYSARCTCRTLWNDQTNCLTQTDTHIPVYLKSENCRANNGIFMIITYVGIFFVKFYNFESLSEYCEGYLTMSLIEKLAIPNQSLFSGFTLPARDLRALPIASKLLPLVSGIKIQTKIKPSKHEIAYMPNVPAWPMVSIIHWNEMVVTNVISHDTATCNEIIIWNFGRRKRFKLSI